MEDKHSFILVINNEDFQFDGDLLSSVSPEIHDLVSRGIGGVAIGPHVPQTAAAAFCSACRGEHFTVKPATAFKIMDLAADCEIPSLVRFVRRYIDSRKLERVPVATSTSSKFFGKLQKVGVDLQNAIISEGYVANGEKFVFRVILFTDFRDLRQDVLVKYAFKRLAADAACALPIFLRIDYDRLTDDQIDQLFETNPFHRVSLNYFIAAALSTNRNEASRHRKLGFANLDQLYNGILADSSEPKLITGYEHDSHNQLAEFQRIVADQQQQLKQLTARRNEIKEQRVLNNRNFKTEAKALRDEIERHRAISDSRKRDLDRMREQIKTILNPRLVELRKHIARQIEAMKKKAAERQAKMETEIGQLEDSRRRNIDRMKTNVGRLDLAFAEQQDDLKHVRASLAAKMIRDFMRFDDYIRRSENRFKIFDEPPGIWSLSSGDVKKADLFLTGMEKKIDRTCPIRTGQTG
jgi:hypothetical protein